MTDEREMGSEMKKVFSKVAMPTAFLLAGFLVLSLLAGKSEASTPSKAEVIQKTQKLQIPFIANQGQVSKEVKYYAKTFGGTVFVTEKGEIVYSLPKYEKGFRDWKEGCGRRSLKRAAHRGRDKRDKGRR